jgi:hypothetical protein
MKNTWDCSDSFDTEIMDREVHIDYDTKGYSDSGKTWGKPEDCYPPESDWDISNIQVLWVNGNSQSEFYMEEGDRNWKRFEKFCPAFLDEIIEATNQYESEQER